MSAEEAPWDSHALNNLLCKIIGSAELVLDRVCDAEARRELASIIQLAEAAARLVKPRARQPVGELIALERVTSAGWSELLETGALGRSRGSPT